MKVLCIKEGDWIEEKLGIKTDGPEYMEVVTVLKVHCNDWYVLLEYLIGSDGHMRSFNAKWFIPLSSDLDENELTNKEYKKELV